MANVGDKIEFTFYPTNHSVVKADFRQPCIPYNMVHPGEEIFFSGPIEQLHGTENPLPTWTLERAFVENGTTTFQLSPGEPFPAEGEIPASSNPPGSTPTAGDDSSGSSSGGSSLTPGAIAGIAIGGAAVVFIGVGLVYVCGRKGGIEKGYRRSGRASQMPPPMVEAHYVDDYPHHGDRPSPFGSPYANAPKSPPPPSNYTASTYGGPPPPEPFNGSRSPKPPPEVGGYGHNRNHSPHASYIGPGQPSPGHPPHAYPNR
ncbi:hypothetical protein SLS62_000332 [Diatrype stigma]|uniref:Uncharacterized protein n=1 Tax=Diatrype stigma TaxID=117547 RepID=A0AAN9YXD5_9PEZI